jgi:hypothetical protein
MAVATSTIPPELEAALNAVVALLKHLTGTTNSFMAELRTDSARLTTDRPRMQGALDELDRRFADAESNVTRVRPRLAVASGRGRSNADEVIELARRVRDGLARLLTADVSLPPNVVHNWLAGVSQILDRYTPDIAIYHPNFARPEGIVHCEVRQAAALPGSTSPPSDDTGLATAKAIAKELGQSLAAVRSALTRIAAVDKGCRKEQERRRGESVFLYYRARVIPRLREHFGLQRH